MAPISTRQPRDDAPPSALPYETLRQRHQHDLRGRLPSFLERFRQPGEELKAFRQQRLRELVRIAKERSAWHRERLTRIDPDSITEAGLARIAPMTKDDLMAHFDAISTDPRVTLERVESHLHELKSDAYLFDRYHVNASGGSSGRRGVAVYDWDAWAEGWGGYLRHLMRIRLRDPSAAKRPLVGAVIAAKDPTHQSGSIPVTFNDPTTTSFHHFPTTLPMEQIVDGVDRLQPEAIVGYASMLHRLATAAMDGALKIAPKFVVGVGEPLLPESRAAIGMAWDARNINWWASTEAGPMATSCGEGTSLHLSDDLLIIEPVDTEGHLVPAGTRSAKVLVTNLFNPTPLPLIRYEITDELTLLPGRCPCGSAHQLVADIQGRLDDSFVYPGVGSIHPHVFRSRLSRERYVVEYQVRQTARGAQIHICCNGPVDFATLRDACISDLRSAGLENPDVEISRVEHIERQRIGKLKRFVPLPV